MGEPFPRLRGKLSARVRDFECGSFTINFLFNTLSKFYTFNTSDPVAVDVDLDAYERGTAI